MGRPGGQRAMRIQQAEVNVRSHVAPQDIAHLGGSGCAEGFLCRRP